LKKFEVRSKKYLNKHLIKIYFCNTESYNYFDVDKINLQEILIEQPYNVNSFYVVEIHWNNPCYEDYKKNKFISYKHKTYQMK